MSSGIIISIKMKPYLKEFIVCYCGDGIEPVIASKKNIVGIYLEPLLERPPITLPKTEKGEEYLRVELCGYDVTKVDTNNYISPSNQKLFQDMVHEFFKELFCNYVDERMRLGFSKKQSILQFCKSYNIPFNNINYEMLKKKHDRHMKKVQKAHKSEEKNIRRMSQALSFGLTAKIMML